MRHSTPDIALVLGALVAAAAIGVAPGLAGSPPKQNGSSGLEPFASICAVDGFASYGDCGGDVTKYTNVSGKINVVQAKPGRYNLGFAFTNLTPGVEYRLWGTYGHPTYFSIGVVIADAAGAAKFSYQTDAPVGLGFDLNNTMGDVTVVSSYWPGHLLAKNADGSLYTLS